jgi:hypothetical protein
MKKEIKFIIVIVAIFLIVIFFNLIEKNEESPASIYCKEQGFELEIKKTSEGKQAYCIITIDDLGNGERLECEEREFYNGNCPSCYDWCMLQPRIMCVGHLEASGKYPDCECNFVCESEIV